MVCRSLLARAPASQLRCGAEFEPKPMSVRSFVRKFPIVRQISRLKSKAYESYRDRRFPSPVYDVFYYVKNREPARQYRQVQAQFVPRPVEDRVIRELREDGISLVHLDDLLEAPGFQHVQAWAEKLIAAPAIQERIRIVEGGARPEAKSGKYFLIRPLGDEPAVDFNDAVMGISISAPVLRIIARVSRHVRQARRARPLVQHPDNGATCL